MRKSTAKPIPIPRDLKPGDIIVDANGEHHTCRRMDDGTCYGSCGDVWTARDDTVTVGRWFRSNGETYSANAPAIRIIRKTSKPARVDRDAQLIEQIINTLDHRGSDGCGLHLYDFTSKKGVSGIKRSLRAIARRLNGGGK